MKYVFTLSLDVKYLAFVTVGSESRLLRGGFYAPMMFFMPTDEAFLCVREREREKKEIVRDLTFRETFPLLPLTLFSLFYLPSVEIFNF